MKHLVQSAQWTVMNNLTANIRGVWKCCKSCFRITLYIQY